MSLEDKIRKRAAQMLRVQLTPQKTAKGGYYIDIIGFGSMGQFKTRHEGMLELLRILQRTPRLVYKLKARKGHK